MTREQAIEAAAREVAEWNCFIDPQGWLARMTRLRNALAGRGGDATPVDEAWLRSVGFTHTPDWLSYGDGWEASVRYYGHTLRIRQSETLICIAGDYWPCKHCVTRGDVRRLAEALGISLAKEDV